MDLEAFFTVHKDLPREGPGEPADVDWALDLARLPESARICDAGAGSGGDVAVLAARGAHVLALEQQPSFAAQMKDRFIGQGQIEVQEGDMADLPDLGPFDMIWCAGALYFLGLEDGLALMSRALGPGGVFAFSEPVYMCATPSDQARAFWDGYPTRRATDILALVEQAGYDILGQRVLADAAWEAYYQPVEARIATLRPEADDRLSAMLDLCQQEADLWRRVKDETGYLLTVARWRG